MYPLILKWHKCFAFFILPILLTAVFFADGVATASAEKLKEIRVGLHDNKPMCYRDEDGNPAGIFVAVLEYTAAQEGWDLQYIDGSWSGQIASLENGAIDILLSMAVSQDRQKLYTFNKADIFTNWAEVYVLPKTSINSLLALKNKRVATSKRGIYTTGPEGILKINEHFKLNISFDMVDSFKDALVAVQEGRADAAVVNRFTGAAYEKGLGLKQSGIVFSPVAIRFAFNKNSRMTPMLVGALDRHFSDLQQDNNSIYYQVIDQALGGGLFGKHKSSTLKVVLFIVFVLTLLFVVLFCFTYLLRRKVQTKTEDLHAINEQLVRSEQQFRRLIESTSTVPWELNLESGKFTYMGDQIEQILGYSADSWTDLKIWSERIHGSDRDEVVQFCQAETKKGRDHEFTYRAIHKDGSIRWIRDVASVVMVNGTPQQLVGFMNDISEPKTLAMEREKLEVRLQQTQKMEAIGTLAGGIAHDFNNILGAILGYADMAREDSPDGSSVANDLDRVLSAGYRAKDLVKQILAFSRQSEDERILMQPSSVVKEVLKMLRPTLPSTILISQNIEVQSGFIMASPTQIHQIVMNLCTNAFHAMEETGGNLNVTMQETLLDEDDLISETAVKPGKFIKLSICDTGAGIPNEIQASVFEPYFTTKELGKGTGMGLSIVHGIVKSYGGFITLYSESGKGCAFHVFLPVAKRDSVAGEQKIEPQYAKGKERILFIDDEVMLAEMGRDMLERFGYHVTVRNSSIEALETFQNQPDQFDLVITDQTMPGLTGVDLVRRFLQIRPDMPIILCTGYSTIVSAEPAKQLGVKEFMLKPLLKSDLTAVVRKVLDGK